MDLRGPLGPLSNHGDLRGNRLNNTLVTVLSDVPNLVLLNLSMSVVAEARPTEKRRCLAATWRCSLLGVPHRCAGPSGRLIRHHGGWFGAGDGGGDWVGDGDSSLSTTRGDERGRSAIDDLAALHAVALLPWHPQ
jgi:hypothetical protein